MCKWQQFHHHSSIGLHNFCINDVVKYGVQDGGWRCQASGYLPHLLLFMVFTCQMNIAKELIVCVILRIYCGMLAIIQMWEIRT